MKKMSNARIFEIAFQLGGSVSPSMRQAFNEARNSMGDMEGSSRKTNKAMLAMKVGAAAVATGIAAVATGLLKAVGAADEFTESMNQIQASTGASAAEMAGRNDSVG